MNLVQLILIIYKTSLVIFLTLYFHFLIMYKTVANKNNIYFSL